MINTLILALVVVQLQRLIPLLRALVRRERLIVRIAKQLGVPVEPSEDLPDAVPAELARADTQPVERTQVGAPPAPAPVRSAALR